MTINELSKPQVDHERLDQKTTAWLAMLERFVALARRESELLQTFSSSSQIYFSQLSPEAKEVAFESFRIYLEAAEQMVAEGLKPSDSRSFLWRALIKFGLRPRSELFSLIGANDLVEIYDKSNHQIFRSLNFLPFCSYGLDEMLSRPWWELFHRDPHVLRRFAKIGSDLLAGIELETHVVSDGRHFVDEIASTRLFKAEVNYKYISPVYEVGGSECAGFVTVFEMLSCVPRKVP